MMRRTGNRNAGRHVTGQSGFTLLELIISVTLLSLMAVSLWAAFRVTIRSWSRGTEFIDINQRNRTILDLVKKQTASIYGLVAPVEVQSGRGIYPIFNGAETSVQFISLTSLRFQDNPGLTMVSYDLVRDHAGNYSLVEREAQYLGLDPGRDVELTGRDDPVVPIFEDLESFSFEYFDPGTADRPERWENVWDGKEMGELPAAISMTMVARDSRGGLLDRRLVVPIHVQVNEPALNFINPFENRQRRLRNDDARINR